MTRKRVPENQLSFNISDDGNKRAVCQECGKQTRAKHLVEGECSACHSTLGGRCNVCLDMSWRRTDKGGHPVEKCLGRCKQPWAPEVIMRPLPTPQSTAGLW